MTTRFTYDLHTIMCELFPQLISVSDGFAPFFRDERHLIASHVEFLYRCLLIYNIQIERFKCK